MAPGLDPARLNLTMDCKTACKSVSESESESEFFLLPGMFAHTGNCLGVVGA